MTNYDIWFCNCGHIHFMPEVEWNWMYHDPINRRVLQVCRNCGAINECTWRHNDAVDAREESYRKGYSSLNDINPITIDPAYAGCSKVRLDKGIRVPLVEGGYADTYHNGIWHNKEYMDQKGYSSCPSDYPNCFKVNTEKLIGEIQMNYPNSASDLLRDISNRPSTINWDGTAFEKFDPKSYTNAIILEGFYMYKGVTHTQVTIATNDSGRIKVFNSLNALMQTCDSVKELVIFLTELMGDEYS